MSRRMRAALAVLAGLSGWLGICWLGLAPAAAAAASVHVVRIDDQINGGTADFLERALERAEAEANVLVIELDTPGGSVDATKDIVSSIMNARIAVIVFVSPRGAWAASAGTFITMAGHVAAMAPGTTIGAAHPVGPQGEDPGGPLPVPGPDDDPSSPRYRGNFIGQKVENMITAFAESIARERGRNVEFAAQAVRESIAITDVEAVEKNVVDLTAQDLDDLLEQVHGREVRVGKETRVLDTRGARVVRIEMTWEEQLLAFLANPVIAFALLSLGMLGLYVEFTNPGAFFPGIGGAICLVLAAFAFQLVPFNPLGIVLIVSGILLMVAEAFVPAFGLLFLAGVVCLVSGGYLVFDVPELQGLAPPFWTAIFPIIVLVVAAGAGLVFAVSRSFFRPVFAGSGVEGIVGQVATVAEALDHRLRVKLQGELWNAESRDDLHVGDRVRIDEVRDLVVRVSRCSAEEEA